jgi:hypothetical protein
MKVLASTALLLKKERLVAIAQELDVTESGVDLVVTRRSLALSGIEIQSSII